jgi:hypothetical protein
MEANRGGLSEDRTPPEEEAHGAYRLSVQGTSILEIHAVCSCYKILINTQELSSADNPEVTLIHLAHISPLWRRN